MFYLHYGDVKWPSWRLELPVNRVFAQQFVQTNNKETQRSALPSLCLGNPSATGPWFNIKMTSYQHRKSHCGDKTILRPSYLHNGISYSGKMTSLYWIRAQVASTHKGRVMRKVFPFDDVIIFGCHIPQALFHCRINDTPKANWCVQLLVLLTR